MGRHRLVRALLLFVSLLAGRAVGATSAPQSNLEVCVFYDGDKTSRSPDGQLHAIMLENLLGHFREASVRLVDVGGYRSGLEGCDRAAYVGTDFGAALPPGFLRDAGAYRKPFLWINYGLWQLQRGLGEGESARKTGIRFLRMRGADEASAGQVPPFFRYFDYKGQRFTKLAAIRKEDGKLIAAPEIARVEAVSARVLATATHSGTGETLPYVTEKDGFFYVADNPFLYIHAEDRYLILADLLFDFLRLPPRSRDRHALVRLEDVHPETDVRLLRRSIDLLRKRRVPFAVSLIPKYVPPRAAESRGVELGRRPRLLKALRYAQDSGGVLLLHGYTHSAADRPDCRSLGTAADYEFWDRCRRRPASSGGQGSARERSARAQSLLRGAGLSAVAWVTPHYAASPDDFRDFGRCFDRTVQRVCYSLPGAGPDGAPVFISQFFPYTIYRDHYGQFVWPEDLGFVPMPGADWGPETPGDIVAAARRMTVVRDGWASFFWHPQLMARPGEAARLDGLIGEIQALGYRFVPLRTLRSRGE